MLCAVEIQPHCRHEAKTLLTVGWALQTTHLCHTHNLLTPF